MSGFGIALSSKQDIIHELFTRCRLDDGTDSDARLSEAGGSFLGTFQLPTYCLLAYDLARVSQASVGWWSIAGRIFAATRVVCIQGARTGAPSRRMNCGLDLRMRSPLSATSLSFPLQLGIDRIEGNPYGW